MVGDAVGALVQVPVGERLLADAHGGRVGRGSRLRAEQVDDGGRAAVDHRAGAPGPQHRLPLPGRQAGGVGVAVGVGCHGLEHRPVHEGEPVETVRGEGAGGGAQAQPTVVGEDVEAVAGDVVGGGDVLLGVVECVEEGVGRALGGRSGGAAGDVAVGPVGAFCLRDAGDEVAPGGGGALVAQRQRDAVQGRVAGPLPRSRAGMGHDIRTEGRFGGEHAEHLEVGGEQHGGQGRVGGGREGGEAVGEVGVVDGPLERLGRAVRAGGPGAWQGERRVACGEFAPVAAARPVEEAVPLGRRAGRVPEHGLRRRVVARDDAVVGAEQLRQDGVGGGGEGAVDGDEQHPGPVRFLDRGQAQQGRGRGVEGLAALGVEERGEPSGAVGDVEAAVVVHGQGRSGLGVDPSQQLRAGGRAEGDAQQVVGAHDGGGRRPEGVRGEGGGAGDAPGGDVGALGGGPVREAGERVGVHDVAGQAGAVAGADEREGLRVRGHGSSPTGGDGSYGVRGPTG